MFLTFHIRTETSKIRNPYLQCPLAPQIIPCCANNLVLELDVLFTAILFRHAFPVLVDFRRRGVER